MPAKTFLNLYDTLVKLHLLYGLVIWESTNSCTTQQPLQLLQNNAVRAITGMSRFEHITSSFRQLDILKIHDLCKIEIALNMRKLIKTINFVIHFNITLLLQVMYIITSLEVSFS